MHTPTEWRPLSRLWVLRRPVSKVWRDRRDARRATIRKGSMGHSCVAQPPVHNLRAYTRYVDFCRMHFYSTGQLAHITRFINLILHHHRAQLFVVISVVHLLSSYW